MTTPTIQGPTGGTGNKIPEGYEQYQLNKFTPEQQQLFQQSYGHLDPNSYLSKLAGGDQSAYAEMEAPALRQFGQLQGNLASRFSGMGTGGRHSSGFQNTMNTAASEFAGDLASKRMEHRRNAIQDLMKFSEMLMGQQPYETGLQKEPEDFFTQFASGLGQAIPGAVVGGITGGIPGAAAGGATGFAGGMQRNSGAANSSMASGGYNGGQTRSGGVNNSFF